MLECLIQFFESSFRNREGEDELRCFLFDDGNVVSYRLVRRDDLLCLEVAASQHETTLSTENVLLVELGAGQSSWRQTTDLLLPLRTRL